jgi:hypothetical protein
MRRYYVDSPWPFGSFLRAEMRRPNNSLTAECPVLGQNAANIHFAQKSMPRKTAIGRVGTACVNPA